MVPFHSELAVTAQMRGDTHTPYPERMLSAEERAFVAKHVDIGLFFGEHATDPRDYTAIEQAFGTFNPDHTIIFFENVGYSSAADKKDLEFGTTASPADRMRLQRTAVLRSRQAAEQPKSWGAHNSFRYAREFCVAYGYKVRSADIDQYEHAAWMRLHRSGEAAQLPDGQELFEQTINEKFLAQPFVEAMETIYRGARDNNALVGDFSAPEIIYKWGDFHKIREQAVVSRLTNTALRLAREREAAEESGPRRQIVLFYGGAHQRGIEMRMRNAGLGYESTNMTGIRYQDAAGDMPFDGQNLRTMARKFMMHFAFQNVGFESADAQSDKWKEIEGYFELLDLNDLQEIYEIFRANMRMRLAGIEAKSPLIRRMTYRQIRIKAPEIMRELTTEHFRSKGVNESKVKQVYDARRAVRQMFTAQDVALHGLGLPNKDR